ncbi:DUF4968 domain-containing protein, partial [Pseudoxanthomonas sp. SGD-10]
MLSRNVFVKAALFCWALGVAANVNAQTTYTRVDNGIIIPDLKGGAKSLQLKFVNDKIVHVLAAGTKEIPVINSLSVLDRAGKTPFTEDFRDDTLFLKTKAIIVKVAVKTGDVQFTDLNGKIYLSELSNGRRLQKTVFDGETTYDLKQYFISQPDEAYFGLGQHQQDIINHKGRQVELLQYNTEISIPFFYSNKNYGVLWDNTSLTYAGDIRKAKELNGLKLFSANGEEGWLTAQYAQLASRDKIEIERPESEVNYGTLDDQYKLPKDFSLEKAVVTWSGSIAGDETGNYQLITKFGGAIKIWVDGKLIADRWRKAWNPSTFILDLALEKNRKYPIKIEWIPEGKESYIDLKTISPDAFAQEETFAFHSEAGEAINYYFIAGENADEVISGYRTLTGKAVMMPKWAMGFWQSRERYKTQAELLDVVREFRKRKMPIDNIVLDWSFWKEDAWGSQEFDLTRFPDAEAMTKEVHKNNMKIMISVWPKIYKGIPVYDKFNEKGYLFKRNIAEG